jgi:cytochrome c peroxidase
MIFKPLIYSSIILFTGLFNFACNEEAEVTYNDIDPYAEVNSVFKGKIDLDNLYNYANQSVPNYITKDNTNTNPISDKAATLGRVLFYDKKLSVNNQISCGSCHKQSLAFGDSLTASIGANGFTSRHSMRLVNARFSTERKFFWDERAATLEAQTTRPIQDHAEMGFSGLNGDPSINDLINKLKAVSYYQELFKFVYGDSEITENRLQIALSQFVRSIQSFDSKYDIGRAQVANDGQPFPNFTNQENMGKNMFLTPPQFDVNSNRIGGGLGCGGCHRPPEFDIDPNSLNNGVIGTISGIGNDLIVTKSPTLRDVVKADGTSNGQFMHNGASNNLITVIDHYNQISTAGNPNLDPRLRPGGRGQNLQLMNGQKDAIVLFLRTLAGSNVYTDPKWSDPF